MRRTVESPIAFGRRGARVANTPRGVVSRNGVTVRDRTGDDGMHRSGKDGKNLQYPKARLRIQRKF